MNTRMTRAVAVLLLVLFAAAGLHTLAPHHTTDDHGQPCALCALFWTVAAVAVTFLVRRRHATAKPIAPIVVVIPVLERLRPWSERAPPSLLFV